MATDGGPNIERDGLVFGMDTGYGVANNSTATRFYRGEPTTNLKSSTQTTGAINGMSGVGVTYVGEEDGWKKYSLSGTFSNGTYPYCMYLSSQQCLAGMRYSTQAIIKTNVRDKFNYFGSNGVSYVNQPKNHEGVNSSTLLSDGSQLLQRQGFEYTSTTTQVGYLWTNPINGTTFNSSTDFVYLKDFQIEQNIHSTPFVSDEREEIESLIDLTKSTNIDVSNVSFDSTGQPTFDGTDDYSQISLTGVNLDKGCTIEGVLKRSTPTTAWRTFFNIKSASSNAPFFEFRSGGNAQHIYADYYNVASEWSTTAATLPTGDFGHAVACYDGNGNIKMYFNGELIGTTTGVASFTLGTSPRLTIGRAYSNDRYTDIVAPIVKVYNRPLLPEEVQQNYNTYKNRFNL